MADPRARRMWLLMTGVLALAVVLVMVAIVVNRSGSGSAPTSSSAPSAPGERGRILAQGEEILAAPAASGREYPGGPLYAPVTGFLSTDHGATGVERAANEDLTAGNTVVVTIDPAVQQAAYEAMTTNGLTGAVVAIKPDDGQILAMVSTPSFDPNGLTGQDAEDVHAQYDADPTKPLLNRAISASYPPGLTFTMVTTAAAFADGRDGSSAVTTAPGIDVRTGDTNCAATATCLRNHNGISCGDGTLRNALVRSCNTAFAQLADQVGTDKLRDQAARFGIGQTDLRVPMPVAPSCLGPRDQCMVIADRPSLFQSGIGQKDVRLTALANASVAATVANGGSRMRPQLVQRTLGPDLAEISGYDADEFGQAMPADDAAQLRDMMIEAEENTRGPGKRADLTIASRTGSSETGPDPRATAPSAWYVAFAPADNPEVAVAVVVESEDAAATGGQPAAGVGRAVIAAALG